MIYELRSENLTHLGGPMGTEYTYDNWRKHFDNLKKAKDYAQKDYDKNRPDENKKLEWQKTKTGIRTDDLYFVMYHIDRVKVEK